MILSVSRRTDIPAFYADWFYERIREGFVEIRNPVNMHQVSKIRLSPDRIECIVFWTKNPSQMFIDNLSMLDTLGYTYYFQFTVTPYNSQIEENVPGKKIVMQTFRQLSEKTGKEKIIWRYDPVFLSDIYTIDYHVRYFDYIASKLSGYTDKCIISFIDTYPKIRKRLEAAHIRELSSDEMYKLGDRFSETAEKYNLKLETCCENINLERIGIEHGHCIDGRLINRIRNNHFIFKKDKTQRKNCQCSTSIDIGAYNTCRHNCIYCYADWPHKINEKNTVCNQSSPLLCSELQPADILTDRKITLCPVEEQKLF
ncbi:MAG: DUF1848 domain-containing protein [Treponema sp.]|nr:DUF1848 domain-containing protein [Treponema sp.]